MAGPQIIVFDLDDTLYLERDFVESGFRVAGAWFRNATGHDGLENRCMALFETGHRKTIFDVALQEMGLDYDRALISRLVDVYQNHKPDIELAPDAERYLLRSAGHRQHALITDGRAATQMTKIHALGLDELVNPVICTGAWGEAFAKPHPKAFEAIEDWAGRSGSILAYVGDNPTKDFITPRARGWLTVQVLRPERVHDVKAPDKNHAANVTMPTLDQLEDFFADLNALDDGS